MNIKLTKDQHNLLTAELENLIGDLSDSKILEKQLFCAVLAEVHQKMYLAMYVPKAEYKTKLSPAQAVALVWACSKHLMVGEHNPATKMIAGKLLMEIHPQIA